MCWCPFTRRDLQKHASICRLSLNGLRSANGLIAWFFGDLLFMQLFSSVVCVSFCVYVSLGLKIPSKTNMLSWAVFHDTRSRDCTPTKKIISRNISLVALTRDFFKKTPKPYVWRDNRIQAMYGNSRLINLSARSPELLLPVRNDSPHLSSCEYPPAAACFQKISQTVLCCSTII